MSVAIVVSCEHASPEVPPELTSHFSNAGKVLCTHRAWDPGAWPIAKMFSERWKAPLFGGEATRLVCDLNRSIGNRTLWSEWTRDLPLETRKNILTRWYQPYREAVAQAVDEAVREGAGGCLHLSIHSFTPVWQGEERRVDLGLLYDPARPREKKLALEIQAELGRAVPALRVRRNCPYRGVSDSFMSALHKKYPDASYLALELEFNQGGLYPAADMPYQIQTFAPALGRALADVAEPLADMFSARFASL